MDTHALWRNRFTNGLHTLLLLAGMALLLSTLGYVLLGGEGVLIVGGLGVAFLLFSPSLSGDWYLKRLHAREIAPYEFPWLHHLMAQLATRAKLEAVPRLFFIPSNEVNAFSLGHGEAASVAVTNGLLNTLDRRELIGVLAHEVGHIGHGDVRVMAMAQLARSMTRALSMTGLIILVINLPFYLFGGYGLPILPILILIAAPLVSLLLQQALSRTREFNADLAAAELTGDPRALASALATMERQRKGNFWQRLFYQVSEDTSPNWLRTHPNTSDRIQRLLALESQHLFPHPSVLVGRNFPGRVIVMHSH